jgi:uncharacterized protein (TIGR02118 family)
MVKAIMLFGNPVDTNEFDAYLEAKSLPMLLNLPHVHGIKVNRVAGAAIGESPFYLMVELEFSSEEKMQEGLNSEIGQTIGRDLKNFASGGVTVLFCNTNTITDNQ